MPFRDAEIIGRQIPTIIREAMRTSIHAYNILNLKDTSKLVALDGNLERDSRVGKKSASPAPAARSEPPPEHNQTDTNNLPRVALQGFEALRLCVFPG